MARKSENGGNFKEPYLALRRNVGILAVALPVLVVLGALIVPPQVGLQTSISAYYHTEMRNVYVGILFAVGVFLFNYDPGAYDPSYKEVADKRAGRAAGIFAILVALFPTWRDGWKAILPPGISYNEELYGRIHAIFAVLLFLTLIYFSYFLFTMSKPGKIKKGSKKELRNNIYKFCAWGMLVCVLLMGVYAFFGDRSSAELLAFFEIYPPLLFLEGIGLVFFGISWFVKGEALAYFND